MFNFEDNQLFADAPVAYSVLDAAGRHVAANRKFWKLFGLPSDTELSVASITHQESRAETESYLHALLSGERDAVVAEKLYVRADGTEFWGRLTAQRMLADDDVLILGVIEDIDEQHQLEARLREAATDQSEFVARVSHELRNPLHTIAGLAELLTTANIDTQERRQAEIILRETRNLTSIVSDLLDIGRFDTGNLVIDAQPFSLRGVIDRSVRAAQGKATDKALRLITTIDDALPLYVIGDAGRLGQVIDNLVGNALKFTATGSISLEVRAEPDSTVKVTVADTGPGIPLDRQAQIFEPFQRLNPSAPGAGLGLAISGRLVESMGGRLELQSSSPEGSIFVFSVPVTETTAPTPLTPGARSVVGSKPRVSRILVVEDNIETQMLAGAQLERLGYSYDIVGDGYRALEITAAASYGAILMDWHLPGIDGLETTRRIRQREQREGRERTPIISVTARAMAADIEACRSAGADDFVAKPASIHRIAEVLETWAGVSGDEQLGYGASVDSEAFATLLDELGDADLVVSLAQTFLTELPRRVGIIVAAESDDEAVQLAAHTLKSTSAMVGAEALCSVAADIEAASSESRPLDPAHVNALHAAAATTETEVLALIQRLESAR